MGSQVEIGCLVPASGASRRMGTNKLYLPFRGRKVLESTLFQLADLPFARKVLVSKNSGDAVKDFQWVDGQHSTSLHQSIRLGLQTLLSQGTNAAGGTFCEAGNTFTACDAVMIALADQPFLETQEYKAFLEECLRAREEGFTLVRPWNGERPGNPCFIDRRHFEEILAEPDHDGGCAYLFQRHKEKTKKVFSPPHFFQDLDTPEEYARWTN